MNSTPNGVKTNKDETLDKLISNYTTANQAIWIEHPELNKY